MSCYEFSPHHGKQQCLWTAQWALASQEAWLISHACSRITHTEDKSFLSTLSITNAHIPDYASTVGVIYKSFASNSGELWCARTHTRTHTHTHTHTHTYTYAHTHTHTHVETIRGSEISCLIFSCEANQRRRIH